MEKGNEKGKQVPQTNNTMKKEKTSLPQDRGDQLKKESLKDEHAGVFNALLIYKLDNHNLLEAVVKELAQQELKKVSSRGLSQLN